MSSSSLHKTSSVQDSLIHPEFFHSDFGRAQGVSDPVLKIISALLYAICAACFAILFVSTRLSSTTANDTRLVFDPSPLLSQGYRCNAASPTIMPTVDTAAYSISTAAPSCGLGFNPSIPGNSVFFATYADCTRYFRSTCNDAFGNVTDPFGMFTNCYNRNSGSQYFVVQTLETQPNSDSFTLYGEITSASYTACTSSNVASAVSDFRASCSSFCTNPESFRPVCQSYNTSLPFSCSQELTSHPSSYRAIAVAISNTALLFTILQFIFSVALKARTISQQSSSKSSSSVINSLADRLRVFPIPGSFFIRKTSVRTKGPQKVVFACTIILYLLSLGAFIYLIVFFASSTSTSTSTQITADPSSLRSQGYSCRSMTSQTFMSGSTFPAAITPGPAASSCALESAISNAYFPSKAACLEYFLGRCREGRSAIGSASDAANLAELYTPTGAWKYQCFNNSFAYSSGLVTYDLCSNGNTGVCVAIEYQDANGARTSLKVYLDTPLECPNQPWSTAFSTILSSQCTAELCNSTSGYDVPCQQYDSNPPYYCTLSTEQTLPFFSILGLSVSNSVTFVTILSLILSVILETIYKASIEAEEKKAEKELIIEMQTLVKE